MINYSAAKSGVYGFAKALAYEGLDYDIAVNVLLPLAVAAVPKNNNIPKLAENYAKFVSPELREKINMWANLAVHFVPIAMSRGLNAVQAAGIASFVGIGSVIGRLGTGILIDRYRASLVGAVIFSLTAAGCALMIAAGNGIAAAVAAALIGLTQGAEVDVIAYLTSRYFGLKSFGALYGGLLSALLIGGALGPLGGSRIYDLYGSYDLALWLAIALMVTCGLTLVSLQPSRPAAPGPIGGPFQEPERLP